MNIFSPVIANKQFLSEGAGYLELIDENLIKGSTFCLHGGRVGTKKL